MSASGKTQESGTEQIKAGNNIIGQEFFFLNKKTNFTMVARAWHSGSASAAHRERLAANIKSAIPTTKYIWYDCEDLKTKSPKN